MTAPAQRRCRPAMGTFVEVRVLAAAPRTDVPAAIDAAFEAVATVAARMSFHDPASDLSALNAARAGSTLRCHPWTVQVLRFARELHAISQGLFDPGIADVLQRIGVLPGRPDAPASSIAELEPLDDERVRLHDPVRLDLGGVAKGFAVDRAIEALADHGVTGAVVDAGGDLRVLGQPQDIHVRSGHGLVGVGRLGDGAIASSRAYDARAARAEAPRALVDPVRRSAVRFDGTVCVTAATCMAADALTKVVALAGALPARCVDLYQASAFRP